MTIEYKDSKRIVLNKADRTVRQGFDGGKGHQSGYTSGGGGSSSSVGVDATSTKAGDGGAGTQSDILTGSNAYYSAGGGGGIWGTGTTVGSGGSSIGGNGSSANNAGGNASGYGSGGGGAGVQSGAGQGVNQTGGNGSAGIVILRFTTSGNGYSQVGGTVTTVGSDTVITYTATSGTTTFTPTASFDVRYLVIGGGAGGGSSKAGFSGGAGGGAGGFRTATGYSVTAKTYNITVGSAGAGGVAGSGNGSNGNDSIFDTITSLGGGGGARGMNTSGSVGQNGSSGGGACPYFETNFGTGTLTDVTPSNVQDNSLLIEKDTAIRYWFDENKVSTSELKAYWRFNNSTVSNLSTSSDSLGSSADLALTGATVTASGGTSPLGYEGVFDGSDDFGKAGTSVSQFDFLHNQSALWTIAFWYKANDLTQGQFIINTSDNLKVADNVGFLLAQGANDSLGIILGTGGGATAETNHSTSTSYVPDTTTWHFYCLTFDESLSSANLNVRRDNANLETFNKEHTNSNSNATYALHVGGMSGFTGDLNGRISEMSIWNRVLTTSEQTALYNSGAGAIVTEAKDATWTWDKQGIRGVFGGGETSTYVNTMDYITMATLGNATDFGNLTASRYNLSSVSSDTRGVFGGGRASNGSNTNIMDYITIATLGDATDFGDLTLARRLFAGVSSNTRGVFAGGYTSGDVNTMDYITIATLGNAIDFGDLTSARRGAANVSSDVRGIFGGGYTGSNVNTMDYITIATPSNAIDFGDLTVARNSASGVSSDVRGVFGGGQTSTYDATMDYITIATLGNATDFGDMTVARMYYGAVSSNIRGIFGGGNTGSITNVIDYITIATTGNATDFGDLSESRKALAGVDDRLK